MVLVYNEIVSLMRNFIVRAKESQNIVPSCLEESCFKINIFPVRTDIVFANFTALKLEFRKVSQLSISLLFV